MPIEPPLPPPDLHAASGDACAANPTQPTAEEIAAMHRLAAIARGNSGQAERCANFLLAWSDADRYGAYDLTDVWACDTAAIRDIVTVFGLIARVAEYPELLDPTIRGDLRAIEEKWRS